MWLVYLLACSGEKSDSAVEDSIPAGPSCPAGTVDAWFMLWSEGGESAGENVVAETEPRCEADFEVVFDDDGGLAVEGSCEVQAGQGTRILSYALEGQWDSGTDYSGTVFFTKPNGEITESSFSGFCDAGPELELSWVMTVTTPRGDLEQSGLILSPVPETEE